VWSACWHSRLSSPSPRPPRRRPASANVAALQVALRARGFYAGTVDGVAGPATAAAVRRLQRRRGLPADGVAGPQTRRALGAAAARGSAAAAALTRAAVGRRRPAVPARHARLPVRHVRRRLGARTDAALRRFQTWAGLSADGVAGPGTLAALRRPPARSPLRFLRPVPDPVGDGFGPRGNTFHPGLDLVSPRAAGARGAGGCVEVAHRDTGGYGKLVVLRHSLGMTSWYGHLSRILVRPGQCVAAGRSSGASARPASRPARTCTSSCGGAAPRSTRAPVTG
jgi:peptidoglycan hydrolase-like protein with peptidoglycan-binding domain